MMSKKLQGIAKVTSVWYINSLITFYLTNNIFEEIMSLNVTDVVIEETFVSFSYI